MLRAAPGPAGEDGEAGLFEEGAVFGAEFEVLEAFSDDGLGRIDGGGVSIGCGDLGSSAASWAAFR